MAELEFQPSVDFKKNAQYESCELIYLGQYEDCCPGDNNSGSSLRNCSKEVEDSMYVILVKGEYMQSSMFIF